MNKKDSKLIDNIIDWSNKRDPKQVDRWLYFAAQYMKAWDWNDKAINDIKDENE